MPKPPALRPVNGLIPTLPPITISGALNWEIIQVRLGYDDAPKAFSARIQAEAAALSQQLAPWGALVPDAVLRAWLGPIPDSVRNTHPNPAGWVNGVSIAVGHLECVAFTEKTQREALQTFTFFPSPADVYAIVSPVAAEFREKVRALKQIAEAPTTGEAA